jgi:hypothetical protein
MKKALVILFYWPPAGGSAVQRWLRFSGYLRNYGWEPVIYAPEKAQYPETDQNLINEIPDGLTIIKKPILEPHQLYKRFVGIKKEEKLAASMTMQSEPKGLAKLKTSFALWVRSNFFIPDARFLWIRPSVKFLKQYIEKEKIDLIITTGPPHSLHLIGLNLHKSSGIPWVADFRDPWTSIDFYTDLKLTRWADRRHHKLESRVLQNANHVIAIGPNMAEEFKRIGAKHVTVITNGYDESDLDPEPAEPDQEFSIVHLGTLSAARNSSALWKALSAKSIEDEHFAKDLKIKLIGNVDYKVLRDIESCGLNRNLECTEFIPHKDAMAILRKAQVLLLLINNSVNAKGVITGKFFEYLAVRRPIMLIGPQDGDASKILSETGGGLSAGFDDETAIRSNLDHFYELYRQDRLLSESNSVARYSRRALTGSLAKVLDTLA